jgi:hypothetical protein
MDAQMPGDFFGIHEFFGHGLPPFSKPWNSSNFFLVFE